MAARFAKPSPHVAACPCCGSKDVKFTNCGYSSFDVATAACGGCQHEIQVMGSDARPAWNRYERTIRQRLLYHWLCVNQHGGRHRPGANEITEAAAVAFLGSQAAAVRQIRALTNTPRSAQ